MFKSFCKECSVVLQIYSPDRRSLLADVARYRDYSEELDAIEVYICIFKYYYMFIYTRGISYTIPKAKQHGELLISYFCRKAI